jgi:hypothetical protein
MAYNAIMMKFSNDNLEDPLQDEDPDSEDIELLTAEDIEEDAGLAAEMATEVEKFLEKAVDEPLAENVYSLTIIALMYSFSATGLHPRRIILASALLLGMLFIQVYFIWMTVLIVTPHETLESRRLYNLYETTMYIDANNVSHTTISGAHQDHVRGIDGFFDDANFNKFNEEDKDAICSIPMSFPIFVFSVVLLWSMTIWMHIRGILESSVRLVLGLQTTSWGTKTIIKIDRENDSAAAFSMTWMLKVVIIVFVQLPRLAVHLVLLWLGSRWLFATKGYGNLLLNAVALEFILTLSSTFYATLVPYRQKALVARTTIPTTPMHGMLTVFTGVACVFYAVWYVFYFEDVLPDFKWDLAKVCHSYLEVEYLEVWRAT